MYILTHRFIIHRLACQRALRCPQEALPTRVRLALHALRVFQHAP